MDYKQINTKVFLNKITSKDYLFAGDYTCDPYQNCEFACLYCDSSFDKTIYVKINAAEIFEKEIKNINKKKIIIGSVHDPYQKAEEEFRLTRKILKLIIEHDLSCHILTKSDLILRDIDLLSEIKNCTVTISFTSLDENISTIFEKNVSTPQIRLNTLEKLSKNNIETNIAIIPILPYIVEKNDLEKTVETVKKYDVKKIVYKHLELKGDQKNYFFSILKQNYPHLMDKYQKLYRDSYMPDTVYIDNLNKIFNELTKKI